MVDKQLVHDHAYKQVVMVDTHDWHDKRMNNGRLVMANHDEQPTNHDSQWLVMGHPVVHSPTLLWQLRLAMKH